VGEAGDRPAQQLALAEHLDELRAHAAAEPVGTLGVGLARLDEREEPPRAPDGDDPHGHREREAQDQSDEHSSTSQRTLPGGTGRQPTSAHCIGWS